MGIYSELVQPTLEDVIPSNCGELVDLTALNALQRFIASSKDSIPANSMNAADLESFMMELDVMYEQIAGRNVTATHIIPSDLFSHAECYGTIEKVQQTELQPYSGISLGLLGHPQPSAEPLEGIPHRVDLPIESVFPHFTKKGESAFVYPDNLSLDQPETKWHRYTLVYPSKSCFNTVPPALEMAFANRYLKLEEKFDYHIREGETGCIVSSDSLPYIKVAALINAVKGIPDVFAAEFISPDEFL